jgi:hypothetical protein
MYLGCTRRHPTVCREVAGQVPVGTAGTGGMGTGMVMGHKSVTRACTRWGYPYLWYALATSEGKWVGWGTVWLDERLWSGEEI